MSMTTFRQFRCCLSCYRNFAVAPRCGQSHHRMPMLTLTDRLDSKRHYLHCVCDRLVWLTALRALYAKYTPESNTKQCFKQMVIELTIFEFGFTLWSSLPLAIKLSLMPPKHELIVNWPCVAPWNWRIKHLSSKSHRCKLCVEQFNKAKRSVELTTNVIIGNCSWTLRILFLEEKEKIN